jgi:hypothetical protein
LTKAQYGVPPQMSQYKDVQALAWTFSAFNALSHCYVGTAGGVGIINKRELDHWARVVADIRDEVKKRRPGIDTQRLFIDAVRYPHMYNSVPDPAPWICDDARIQLLNIAWVFFPHPKDNVPAQILAIMKMMRCERSGPCSEAVYKELDLAKLSVVMGIVARRPRAEILGSLLARQKERTNEKARDLGGRLAGHSIHQRQRPSNTASRSTVAKYFARLLVFL